MAARILNYGIPLAVRHARGFARWVGCAVHGSSGQGCLG